MTAAPLLLAVVLALAGARPAEVGVWPVDGTHVVEPFAPPEHDWQAGHRGVGLAADPGAGVRAMAAGRVAFAGRVAGKPVVSVELADGRRVTYEPVLASVVVGQRVAAGDVLGVVVGSGGHCGGECLHVGLRTGTGYADPLSLLGRRPAILKPL